MGLQTIIPLAVVVAVGWWFAGRHPQGRVLADLAVGVAAPCLAFTLFLRMDWSDGSWVVLVGGAAVVMAATALAGRLAFPWFAAPHRGVLLPIAFWNSGNMGLSVAELAFGEEALPAAAVVFVTVATAQALLGTLWANGRDGLEVVVRMPLVHACLAGLACSLLGVAPPALLLRPLEMLAQLAVPLMLVSLGMQLRTLRAANLRDGALVVTLRSGGGLLAALAFVTLADVQGLPRQLLLVEAVLPPAVINVLFAQRFGAAPDTVASSIVLGTLASVVTLPLVLTWVA